MQNSQELLADAIRLRNENNVNEAALAFAKVIKEFEKSTDPAVRENVAEALLNLGVLFNLTGNTEPCDYPFRSADQGTSRLLCFLHKCALQQGRRINDAGSFR